MQLGGFLTPAIKWILILNGGIFYKCLIYSALEFVGGGLAAGCFMLVPVLLTSHPTGILNTPPIPPAMQCVISLILQYSFYIMTSEALPHAYG